MAAIGKIIRIDKSAANIETRAGRILRVNGEEIQFVCTSHELKENDPVLFEIKPCFIRHEGSLLRLAVAYLPEGYDELLQTGESTGKWKNENLHQKWRCEWGAADHQLRGIGFSRENWENFRMYKK